LRVWKPKYSLFVAPSEGQFCWCHFHSSLKMCAWRHTCIILNLYLLCDWIYHPNFVYFTGLLWSTWKLSESRSSTTACHVSCLVIIFHRVDLYSCVSKRIVVILFGSPFRGYVSSPICALVQSNM
jgi:hypothetical protein